MVIFSDKTGKPPDHLDVRLARKLEFDRCLVLSMSCGVPTPIVPPINKVCAVPPLPVYVFSSDEQLKK